METNVGKKSIDCEWWHLRKSSENVLNCLENINTLGHVGGKITKIWNVKEKFEKGLQDCKDIKIYKIGNCSMPDIIGNALFNLKLYYVSGILFPFLSWWTITQKVLELGL